MTSETSPVTIDPPDVPADFQFKGSSAEIMRQILGIVSQSKILNVQPNSGTPLDFAAVQKQLADMQVAVDAVTKARYVVTQSVETTGEQTVFLPTGSVMSNTNYSVGVTAINPTIAAKFTWTLKTDSKAVDQFVIIVATDADLPIQIEVVIQQN